jgi:surface antigen
MKIITFAHKSTIVLRTTAFLLALLGTTALPILINPPSAQAGTDTYPTSIAGCKAVSGTPPGTYTCDLKDDTKDIDFDPWLEENRECVSYVAWMLSSVNSFPMPFHDNAVNWKTKAVAAGYTVDTTPKAGSIFWTAAPTNIGHVAYVESVSTDGTHVTTMDYNQANTGVWAEHPNVLASTADGYIHFKDLSAAYHYQPFAGDFNADGIGDIGLRDSNNGTFYIKHGPNFSDQISYQWAAGTNYQPFIGDFNHDGYADIGLYDQNSGWIYIKHGPSFSDQISYQWAAGANYQVFAADFNGDGYADIGLRDMNIGTFYIKHGPSFSDQISYNWAAGSNYIPFAADFNKDGLADIGLYDKNVGIFYIKHGTSFSDQISYQWAAGSNYQPFVGDFNGDGYADIGLRDANIGWFYIKHGTSFNDQITYQWVSG